MNFAKPSSVNSKLSQTQRERLAFIDFRVFFCGEFRRCDLENRFGIAPAAATRDLTLYRSLAPKNLVYDPSAKTYLLNEQFRPLFDLSTDRALTWLRQGFGDGLTLKSQSPVLTEGASPLAPPPLGTLATLSRAIYLRTATIINYVSLSSGKSSRVIVPVALVDNGLRWHVRAYDRQNCRFGDFVVNRITAIETTLGPVADHELIIADQQWNQILELQLTPHSGLKYPEAVAADYGMVKGELQIQTRAAIAGYALHRWQVDCSPDAKLNPMKHHLQLANPQALTGVESAFLAPGYERGDDNVPL